MFLARWYTLNEGIKFLKKLPFGILMFIEVFAILFMNFLFIFGVPLFVGAESAVPGNRWMCGLPDRMDLCDINIPGTHDSGTRYTIGVVSGVVASCQDDVIPDQLEKGVRYLDIRCDGDLDINHGGFACYTNILTINKYKLTFPKVLDDIENFLDRNPSETVLLQLKKEGIGRGDFFRNVNKELEKRSKLYRPQTSYPDSIKLGEVRGKFVVCSRNLGVNLCYNYHGWTDNCICAYPDLDDSDCMLQDNYKSFSSKEKLRVIKAFYEKVWSENVDDKFVINFTSCIGPYCPELVARRINPEFESYIRKNRDKKFGIVLMDVPTKSLISEIYGSNF